VKLSVNVTDYSWSDAGVVGGLADLSSAIDETGLDTLWVTDHLLQAGPWSTFEAEMLEAYTTLGYLAARTERVRLGAMVSPVTYRAPSLLIKQVTTLDVVSDGRAWFGIGAGYQEEEARALGLSLPPIGQRFEALEETLMLAKQMWRGETTPFVGRHYRLERPISSPLPTTRPHPPILIGGTGERKTLRLVAEHADACNLFDIPDGGVTIRRKLEVLADHCQRVGRPFSEIEKTVSTRLNRDESSESFTDRLLALAELGIEHAVVITDHALVDADLTTLARTAAAIGPKRQGGEER
jgi:F420-dependent oxidoreductase-like protein